MKNTFVLGGGLCVILAAQFSLAKTGDARAEVLKAEAAFSDAKIHNDVAALNRILADEFVEINMWGARRNKQAMIALFRDYRTLSFVPSRLSVRVSGDVAIVEGAMFESNRWKYLLMRTYVKRRGRWLLLSSAQNFVMDENFKLHDPEGVYQ